MPSAPTTPFLRRIQAVSARIGLERGAQRGIIIGTGQEEKTRILKAIANEDGAASEAVPYRCSRGLIFGAGRVHRKDKFSFRTGYDDRRCNVTFLLGPPA
jgi:hypothetical protein